MEINISREGNPLWKLKLKFDSTEELTNKVSKMAHSNFELKSSIENWDSFLKGFAHYVATNLYQFLYACQIQDEARRLNSCQELLTGLCPNIKEVEIMAVDAPNLKDHEFTISQSV